MQYSTDELSFLESDENGYSVLRCPLGHSIYVDSRSISLNSKIACLNCSHAIKQERKKSVEKGLLWKYGERQVKWDIRWLKRAKQDALEFSKDPSTKVGAIIIDKNNSVVSTGYNGFGRGVDDSIERYENRETKYKLVVHAEINAIIYADRMRLENATLYTWPFMPCSNCAAVICNTGIKRVVAPELPEHMYERWHDSVSWSMTQFREAGIDLSLYVGDEWE